MKVALIDEAACIGCAKCLPVCPVDAILGAEQRMHTVIAAECTGCGRCLPPCPVDCITLVPVALPTPAERRRLSGQYRRRHESRQSRLARQEQDAAAARARHQSAVDERVAAALTRVPR